MQSGVSTAALLGVLGRVGPHVRREALQGIVFVLLEAQAMKPNAATVDLIKSFEGCRLAAYKDVAGVWTIGWGLTTGALPGVSVSRGMAITQMQADEYLTKTLELFGNKILPAMTRKPTPNQFGAMLSLAYNVGTGGFKKSTVLRKFNADDFSGAAAAFAMWNKAGGKIDRGLVRRRAAEAALFLADSNDQVYADAVTVDEPTNTAIGSTTMQATVVTVGSGVGAAVTAVSSLDSAAQYVVLGFAGLVILAGLWVARERLKKLADGH
jgi:lysozyme